ncbi:hemolysin activation/secretion protein [Novosphingobium sp. PhB165]|uniref:ShlB/FhaC/HecB family hemolysin secretion/activation protein n=1 Tax=Novosphingobium sp. PhB165 TaxID=2485105 RepID=UPI001049EEC3|nr:ShlB/FhaC/HecB family hemolysin secretion/activation protein [Novosphingobium sp. PhB165]TCM18116.1 hemolysin activation/secretion protein [Novosphingobium sp. PhB165]
MKPNASHREWLRVSGIGGALSALLAPGMALAQVAAPLPLPTPQTREELKAGQETPPATPARPRLTIDDDIERGPCPLAAPGFAATRVRFSRVEFGGLKAVDPAILDDTWRDMAGKDLPVSALCEVRDRAATALRALGYLAAVQIPPQRIEKDGTVHFDVMVAHLVEVQVRGRPGPAEKQIAAYLNRLTHESWFNTHQAERQLLLLGDMPGYEVRLTLRPAKGKPGDVVGDLLVHRRPFELGIGLQNLGSSSTGPTGVFVQAALNGLTGLADRTSFSLFNTLDFDEQTVLQAGHEFAIGTSGLRLGGNILWGRSEPSGPLRFKTETVVGDVGLTYPVIRRRAMSLRAGAGLEVVDQDLNYAGAPFTRDRLRVLYGRLAFDTIDHDSLLGRGRFSLGEPRWRLGGLAELRQGLRGLGASDDCSPITQCLAPHVPISNQLADPSAFVMRAQVNAEFRPVPGITLALSPRAQYSPDTLLSYEQFSLGNYTIGRGLDPGTVAGDSGIGAAFEVRYGRLSGRRSGGLVVQPYAFVDAGWAWRHRPGALENPDEAWTAGGGLRGRWNDRFDGNLSLAVPLNRTGLQAERGDVRVLFTIRARLLPWDAS